MTQITFIGYAPDSITTRRGEVKPATKLYFLFPLQNGTGHYGAMKSVANDRLIDMGGIPELGCLYDVSFNQWGNFETLEKVKVDVFK